MTFAADASKKPKTAAGSTMSWSLGKKTVTIDGYGGSFEGCVQDLSYKIY
jgi:hypothetical protein